MHCIKIFLDLMVSRAGRENDHQGGLLPIQPVHKAHVSYFGPTYVINKDWVYSWTTQITNI